MQFDNNRTVAVIFDTEWYVPSAQRSAGLPSLKANPAIDMHMFLGGAFLRFYPLVPSKGEERMECFAESLDPTKEKGRLEAVYRFFKDSWNKTGGGSQHDPDLVAIGTGISRLDLPGLYTRSLVHAVDGMAPLYETYLKTKIVDLSEVAIPYMNKKRPRMLYPVTTNSIATRFGLGTERKDSGKTVWDMADSADFEGIRERTISEIEVLKKIYWVFVENIFSRRGP